MFPHADCLVSFYTTQAVKLRHLYEYFNAVLGDANLEFWPEGVFLSAVTNSQMMVVLNLFSKDIESYYCSEHVRCGIKFTTLYSYLRTVTDTDVVAIQVTKEGFSKATGQNAYLFIRNEGDQRLANPGRRQFTYELRLLNVQTAALNVPPVLEMASGVMLPAGEFHKILRSHATVASADPRVQFMVKVDPPSEHTPHRKTGILIMTTEGDDAFLTCQQAFELQSATENVVPMFCEPTVEEEATTSSSTTTDAPKDNEMRIIMDATNTALETTLTYDHRDCDKRELYSLKTLIDVSKLTNVCSVVRIFLQQDAPLILCYDVGTLGTVWTFIPPYTEEAMYGLDDILRVPALHTTKTLGSDKGVVHAPETSLQVLNNTVKTVDLRKKRGRKRKYVPAVEPAVPEEEPEEVPPEDDELVPCGL